VSDETPFEGVAALPAASTIRAVGSTVQVIDRRRPLPPTERRDRLTATEVDALAAAITAAVEPLRRHSLRPELGLSGGRDSRMVAAALHAAGIPFDASTRGFDDQPDAIVARLVAAALGVQKHRVWAPKRRGQGDRVEVEHPLERAHRAVWIGEGMNSALDDLNGSAGFRVAPRLSGSGGEIIRGGYLYNQQDLSPRAIRIRIERLFTSGSQLLRDEANERAQRALRQWTATAGPDHAERLAALYLQYRVGRWRVGPRTSTLLNWTYYHPLLDNRVVRLAAGLPALARWNEQAVHALITRLAPRLRDLPLEGHRWRYEQARPRSLFEIRAWRRRYLVSGDGRTAGFDWRLHHDRPFAEMLREAVMDGPAELFRLVDREQVDRLFQTVPVTSPPIVWRLLTLSVLLSGGWRRGEWTPLGTVEVPIPPSVNGATASL